METSHAGAAILFDLDGTLTDPFVGITRSIRYALEKMGRVAPPADDLRWCIGPPLKQAFPLLLGSEDEALVDEAVRLYRERYSAAGKFENRLIEGIPEALSNLAGKGYFLTVATSKLETYAGEIVDHFGLRQFFPTVYGSEADGRNAAKSDLIAHVLETEALSAAHSVMVGDRSHDIVGAAANGVGGLGVLWGYGDRAELDAAGAAAIAARPHELPEILGHLIEGRAARTASSGASR